MGDHEIVEMTLADGTSVLVKAAVVDGLDEGPQDVAFPGVRSFSSVSKAVRGIADEIHQAVADARPDVVVVEFGMDLAIKGSALVAMMVDAKAAASMKIRLEWHAAPRPDPVSGTDSKSA